MHAARKHLDETEGSFITTASLAGVSHSGSSLVSKTLKQNVCCSLWADPLNKTNETGVFGHQGRADPSRQGAGQHGRAQDPSQQRLAGTSPHGKYFSAYTFPILLDTPSLKYSKPGMGRQVLRRGQGGTQAKDEAEEAPDRRRRCGAGPRVCQEQEPDGHQCHYRCRLPPAIMCLCLCLWTGYGILD